VRARDVSAGTRIPAHYLSKILRQLVLGGVLESRKGKGGGFSLARPPGEISFESVLRAVNAYPDSGHCAFGWGSCDPTRPCPLHDSWIRMGDQFRDWAATTTLAEPARVPLRPRTEPPPHDGSGQP
jgi:Rrf2 family iron-sulfur cluster assembly transcriptional regulator